MNPELRQLVDALGALPVLAGADPKQLRELAQVGRHVRLPAHWAVVHERTPGDTCYLVLSGEAEVRRDGEPIATLGRGALFGEAGTLDRHLRNASVVAVTVLEVLSMQCADLFALLERHPDLGDRLLADYRRRAAAAT